MTLNKIKTTLVYLSFSLLLLIALFYVAELVVRSIYKNQTVLFPRYHTDAQYGSFTLRKIRPNSEFWHTSIDGTWKFTTNNKGFRNKKDFSYAKDKDIKRIISLGDSHTQGYEVRQDYTFSAVMEKYLNAHGQNTEVINAGVSGFSTAEELLFLENEGIKYNPDIVVLGFYANDFQDNLKADFFRLSEDGELILQKQEHIPGVNIQNFIYSLPFVKWFSENSYFYSILFNNTWEYFKSRLANNALDKVVEFAVPTQDKVSNYQATLTTALLNRMYAFCQKNKIKLIILDIPQLTEDNQHKTSFSESMSRSVTNYSDGHIISEPLLADYKGVAEIHKPHGHQHISEFTHSLIGVSTAKLILSMNP